MKKIIAIAMALVMMLAVAVPAFAAGEFPNGKETKVSVDETTITEDAQSYEITVPAEFVFAWGDTDAKKDEVSTTASLLPENMLLITAEKAAMTDGNDNTMDFECDFDKFETVSGEDKKEFSVSIPEKEWKTKPVAAYSGTITFSAKIVEKPAA